MDEDQIRLAEELLFSGPQKPSFAKMMYFGAFDGPRVFPFPEVSAEEKKEVAEYVKKVDAFCKKEIDADWIDRNETIPDKVIQGLGELGVLGLSIPKENGGMGCSQYHYCKTMEVVARHCAATALFVNAHQSVGMKALVLYGTPEQRDRWLAPLAKGNGIAAFSLTEPTAGSDAAGVRTRATYDPEKKVYRIKGEKQWTTNGSIAEILTVMAQTEIDGEDKITAFLVTPDMPGFKIKDKALEKVGMRGSTTSNLIFDNVEVPEANILGPKGGGLKVALNVLNYGRVTFGATCTGAAKYVLEKAFAHATTREQFRRPLSSFSLVKKKLANMSALVYAMDATTYLTAGLLDSGQSDVMLESAMLKVFASDALWDVLYDTMQIYGGRSFFTTEPLERMMRDARLNMIGEGSNEVMRTFIGVVGMRDVGMQLQKVLGAFKSPVNNCPVIWAFLRQWIRKIRVPMIPVESKVLQEEASRLASAVRRFGLLIPRLLGRYREAILEKQMILDRLATVAMAIYTTTAVISKLDRDLRNNTATENDIAVAKLYCKNAMATIDQQLSSVYRNHDKDIESVSDQLSGLASV